MAVDVVLNGTDALDRLALTRTTRVMHPFPGVRFAAAHPRQEPSAVIPHAGICAGAAGKGGPYRDLVSPRHVMCQQPSGRDRAGCLLRVGPRLAGSVL